NVELIGAKKIVDETTAEVTDKPTAAVEPPVDMDADEEKQDKSKKKAEI
ncbi:MAG: hypothetical protein HY976_02020, partial [Candidatus Kerfeldbacteria bacterium]|nr:hypothetical protein [Candidatus Kerfeldbacteria bacterium]